MPLSLSQADEIKMFTNLQKRAETSQGAKSGRHAAVNAEVFHSIQESGALDAHACRRSIRATHSPSGFDKLE